MKQSEKLKLDPTKSTEEKVQHMVKKIKSKLTIQEYKRMHPRLYKRLVPVQESFMVWQSYIKLIQKD